MLPYIIWKVIHNLDRIMETHLLIIMCNGQWVLYNVYTEHYSL